MPSIASAHVAERSRRPACVVAVATALAPVLCLAGPPLVSDDPHTVGPGQVELILAVDALDQGPDTSVGPTLDLTLGLLEGLDATLVATPAWELQRGSSSSNSEFVEAGMKWQPIMTSRWSASFTPALGTTIAERTEFAIVLPLQVEYTGWRNFGLGADGAFIPIAGGADAWRAGGYATWQAHPTLALLSEVWASGLATSQESIVGVVGGVDWTSPLGLHLLAAGGTGVHSEAVRRLDWNVYVGVLWAFAVW